MRRSAPALPGIVVAAPRVIARRGVGLRRFRRYISIPVLLIAWELASRTGKVNAYLLPAVSDIATRWWSMVLNGELIDDAGVTLYRTVISLLIAAAVAIPLGVAMSRVRGIHWFFDPLISVGFSMPKIAFLPIFILWFGFFDLSKVAMAVFALVFPLASSSYLAARGVDHYLVWSAENMGTRGIRLVRRVIVPAALPEIMSGFQTAVPLAFIIVIISELLAAGRGIGDRMMYAARFADSRTVFAEIVTIALLGLVSMKLVELSRQRLLRWHEEASK